MTLWFAVKIWYNKDAGNIRFQTHTTTKKGNKNGRKTSGRQALSQMVSQTRLRLRRSGLQPGLRSHRQLYHDLSYQHGGTEQRRDWHTDDGLQVSGRRHRHLFRLADGPNPHQTGQSPPLDALRAGGRIAVYLPAVLCAGRQRRHAVCLLFHRLHLTERGVLHRQRHCLLGSVRPHHPQRQRAGAAWLHPVHVCSVHRHSGPHHHHGAGGTLWRRRGRLAHCGTGVRGAGAAHQLHQLPVCQGAA